MICNACQKTPADYAEHQEKLDQGESVYYTPRLKRQFREVNPPYEFCRACKEGTESLEQRMAFLKMLNETKITIPISTDAQSIEKFKNDVAHAMNKPQPKQNTKKQKRNALCSCNSGKKYKKCCLIGQRLEKKI